MPRQTAEQVQRVNGFKGAADDALFRPEPFRRLKVTQVLKQINPRDLPIGDYDAVWLKRTVAIECNGCRYELRATEYSHVRKTCMVSIVTPGRFLVIEGERTNQPEDDDDERL